MQLARKQGGLMGDKKFPGLANPKKHQHSQPLWHEYDIVAYCKDPDGWVSRNLAAILASKLSKGGDHARDD